MKQCHNDSWRYRKSHSFNTGCIARVSHLVDGQKIGALGSVRVVPLQSLVHVCFALAKLAKHAFVDKGERSFGQYVRHEFKTPVTPVNEQGL